MNSLKNEEKQLIKKKKKVHVYFNLLSEPFLWECEGGGGLGGTIIFLIRNIEFHKKPK